MQASSIPAVQKPHWAAPREELAIDMARFEWAQVVAFDGPSKTPITPDDILDTPPSRLRLALQPYLSLLDLDYAVDDFLIAVKKRESNVLRGEASNAVDSAPAASARRKRIRLPKRKNVYLVVHRHDNMLYYKRLDPEAFAILSALDRGATLETACADAVAASKRTNADWQAQIKEWFENWAALRWFCHRSEKTSLGV